MLPTMTKPRDKPQLSPSPDASDDASRPIGYLERRCPVRTAIDVISGRWKPSILELLHERPRRHRALLHNIPGISSQALSAQLRQLMADDVIEKDGGEPPLYRLTERGNQLADVMDGLAAWGSDYLGWRGETPRPSLRGQEDGPEG